MSYADQLKPDPSPVDPSPNYADDPRHSYQPIRRARSELSYFDECFTWVKAHMERLMERGDLVQQAHASVAKSADKSKSESALTGGGEALLSPTAWEVFSKDLPRILTHWGHQKPFFVRKLKEIHNDYVEYLCSSTGFISLFNIGSYGDSKFLRERRLRNFRVMLTSVVYQLEIGAQFAYLDKVGWKWPEDDSVQCTRLANVSKTREEIAMAEMMDKMTLDRANVSLEDELAKLNIHVDLDENDQFDEEDWSKSVDEDDDRPDLDSGQEEWSKGYNIPGALYR